MGPRKRNRKTPEQTRKKVYRRQRMLRALGRMAFLCVLVAAAVFALTIFFKIDTISVEGLTEYRAEEVVAGMDVQRGDNLYLWNKVKVTKDLLAQFPYLESVQIRRHLPDTLVVSVTECTAVAAVPKTGGYCLISETGKVLEQRADDAGLPHVVGMYADDWQPGSFLPTDTDQQAEALMELMKALDQADMLADVDFYNLQQLTDVRVGYLGRFDIRLGDMDELDYWLSFCKTVINERLSPSDIGRLYIDSSSRLHFVPDTAENVAASGMVQSQQPQTSVDLDSTASENDEEGQSTPVDAVPSETTTSEEDTDTE